MCRGRRDTLSPIVCNKRRGTCPHGESATEYIVWAADIRARLQHRSRRMGRHDTVGKLEMHGGLGNAYGFQTLEHCGSDSRVVPKDADGDSVAYLVDVVEDDTVHA